MKHKIQIKTVILKNEIHRFFGTCNDREFVWIEDKKKTAAWLKPIIKSVRKYTFSTTEKRSITWHCNDLIQKLNLPRNHQYIRMDFQERKP